MSHSIEENIKKIKQDIVNHCPSQAPSLIAVSKTKPVQYIRQAISAGQKDFGENKVQEALEKWPDLKKEHPALILHLIGPLQKNKVRKAIGLFDVIQTLDRPSLAEAIARIKEEENKNPQLYIQVNIGSEPQKSGILSHELHDFYDYCKGELKLAISGLMAIPPYGGDVRPYFKQMHRLKEQLALPYLSMGMSHDYMAAISEGATHIRVGSFIFGER